MKLRIHREIIDVLRFADDIAILTINGEELMAVLEEIEHIFGSKFNIKINKKKIKVFLVSRHDTKFEVALQRRRLQNVEEFTYVVNKITSEGRIKTDLMKK